MADISRASPHIPKSTHNRPLAVCRIWTAVATGGSGGFWRGKTLYMTARTSLYRIKLSAEGLVYRGD